MLPIDPDAPEYPSDLALEVGLLGIDEVRKEDLGYPAESLVHAHTPGYRVGTQLGR